MNIKNKYYFLYLIFVIGAFYTINIGTPFRCDDLIYQFFWLYKDQYGNFSDSPVDFTNRIDDFYEALLSQFNHYMAMNGRFPTQYIVSCFCGFIGRPIFSICNTIIYILFILGCLQLLNIKSDIKKIFAIAALWLIIPIQHIFWYSISFAVNYLWTATAFIWYFIFLKKTIISNQNMSIIKLALLFFTSLILGTMHEGYTVPLCGTFFIYLMYNRKNIRRQEITMALGMAIGTAIVVFAPGTLSRASSNADGIDMQGLLNMKLDLLKYSKRLYLFLILLGLSFYLNRLVFHSYCKKHVLEIVFIVMDFLFVLVIPSYTQRTEFPLELLSSILFIGLFLNSIMWDRFCKPLCCIFTIAILIHIPFTIHYNWIVNQEYTDMLNEYLSSPTGITHYRDIHIPKAINPYVRRLDNIVEYKYISLTFGKNMVIENQE